MQETQQEPQVPPLGREDPLQKEMQPAPVFLPGKSHGQRSLAGYSPWGHERAGQDLVTKQHILLSFFPPFFSPTKLYLFLNSKDSTHSFLWSL